MLKSGQETLAGKRFTFTTQVMHMHTKKFIFPPRLKFECDYMRFFSRFVTFQPRLNLLHVIANVFLIRFVQQAELESQPGLKFVM